MNRLAVAMLLVGALAAPAHGEDKPSQALRPVSREGAEYLLWSEAKR